MFQPVNVGEPTADQVAAAVEQLLPDAAPVRLLGMLRKGRSHASWVLDSSRGALVGKVGRTGHTDAVLRRLAEHRRVWEHGVPVPRLWAFTGSSGPVGGRPLIVSEYLPGQDADEASRSLPPASMDRVMVETGAALARLHQVPVAAFGDAVTGLEVGSDSWSVTVASRVELVATGGAVMFEGGPQFRPGAGDEHGVAVACPPPGLPAVGGGRPPHVPAREVCGELPQVRVGGGILEVGVLLTLSIQPYTGAIRKGRSVPLRLAAPGHPRTPRPGRRDHEKGPADAVS